MKKRFNKYFPILFIAGELTIISALFFISYYRALSSLEFEQVYSIPFIVYLALWSILSYSSRGFKIGRAVSYFNTIKRAFTSVFVFVSIISLMWLFLPGIQIDREFVIFLILLLFIWITIYRITVHFILDRYRTFGGNIKNAVIIGYDQLGFRLHDLLDRKQHYGIRCRGIYSVSRVDSDSDSVYPYSGIVDDFFKSDLSKIDSIYISDRLNKATKDELIQFADSHAKRIKLLPEFKTDLLKVLVLRKYESVSVIDINNLPLDRQFNRVMKRSFDLFFSLFVIVFFLSWMWPLFGLIIRLESNGPVFFKQFREGKDGSKFICLKFRTMVQNEHADTKWAARNDPRTTRFGSFLRRTSLDEFPQFLNVLLGQMSVVGPRPHPISLNEAYKGRVEKFAKRHESKPGITGLAQAMGHRGEISELYQMNSRVKLDRFYLQNWSFLLDIKIMFLTVFGIAKGQDKAY